MRKTRAAGGRTPAKSTKKAAAKPTAARSAKRAATKKPTAGVGREAGRPRRAVFIDVENTSSEEALFAALEQLGVDRSAVPTDLVAVGNWRVIGAHVARMLARHGARLIHTAPATGVKDWSDLSIAVAAGIWLGRAEPGDTLEIVSADRAFDAVADAATALGVTFRRLTYGPPGVPLQAPVGEAAEGSAEPRRGGRRRRGRSGRGRFTRVEPVSAPAAPEPVAEAGVEPPSGGGPPPSKDLHAASPDEILSMIARLSSRDPERGVNLDLLINALKHEGFGRPPGSPRLVTRLRKMKNVEVSPTGMVRLVDWTAPPPPAPQAAPAAERRRRSGRRGGRRRRGGDVEAAAAETRAAESAPPTEAASEGAPSERESTRSVGDGGAAIVVD